MILLLANAPFLSLSCLPQRSYTLIVEALDFNNETSGECSSLSGISILPSPLFSAARLTATSGRSRVVEGQKRKFILSELPALFNMVHWVCVCVCVKVSVLTGAFKRAGHGSEWEEEEEEGRVGTGRWRGCS